MFLFGADPSGHRFDDYRPQVHDSDGFMAQTGTGEWLWRPLSNPRELRINRFMDQQPRGIRPDPARSGFLATTRTRWRASSAGPATGSSRWATGARAARSWSRSPPMRRSTTTSRCTGCPSSRVTAGKELHFSYLLSAHRIRRCGRRAPRCSRPASPAATADEQRDLSRSDARRVIIDFGGGDLDGLDATQPLKALLTVNGGTTENVTVERLEDSGRVARQLPGGAGASA